MKVASKKQMEQLSGQGGTFMKVEKGDTKIRVVSDIHAVMEHRCTVEGKVRFIACPTENARMAIAAGVSQSEEVPPCPLCEKGYPAKVNYLAKVVEREHEANGKLVGGKAYILKKGKTLLGEIQNLVDDENWGDPRRYDIKLSATGDGLGRKYGVSPVPVDKSPELNARERESLRALDEKVDLDQMTTPRPYAEIVKIVGDIEEYDEAEAEYGRA